MRHTVYGNFKCIPGKFEYRGIIIVIFAADKGAVHCKKQHDYRSKTCAACAAHIAASQVFLGFINEAQVTGDCDSPEDAFESAKVTIEDAGGAKHDEVGRKRPTGNERQRRIEQIKKLGWGARALAMLKKQGDAPQLPPKT